MRLPHFMALAEPQRLKKVVTHGLHGLHHTTKAIGYLPDIVLNRLNTIAGGHSADELPEADAHMRLILGLSNKARQPLTLETLSHLRTLFSAIGVSLQDPQRIQNSAIPKSNQASDNQATDKGKSKGKKSRQAQLPVSYYDQSITNSDGKAMRIRCYQAGSGNPDEIAMLFMHGGGFCIGSIATHHEFCHQVCEQTGWSVVSVDYRLAPKDKAPTALYDSVAAYQWLCANAPTLGALPERIVVSGDSAGGCLATLLAQLSANTTREATAVTTLPKAPLAQVLLYPITDFDNIYPSRQQYGSGMLLNANDMDVFSQAYLKNNDGTSTHPLVSPMHGYCENLCPALSVIAELDLLKDEGLAYAKKLQECGTEVEIYRVKQAPHGFLHFMSVHKGMRQETTQMIAKMRSFVSPLLTEAK